MRKSQMNVSVAVMIIGALFFLYALFTSYSESNMGNSNGNLKNGTLKIYLPPIKLSTEETKKLIFNIPYIYLEGDGAEKEYTLNLDDDYNYLEVLYRIKEQNNAILGIFFNNFMVSFSKNNFGYYGIVDKSIFQNSKEIDIIFSIKKEHVFSLSSPKVIIEDFTVYGHKELNKAELSFKSNTDKDLLLVGKIGQCRRGTLKIQVNNCEPYYLKFNCNEIKYLIPKICLQTDNKIKLILLSGFLDLKELYLIPKKE